MAPPAMTGSPSRRSPNNRSPSQLRRRRGRNGSGRASPLSGPSGSRLLPTTSAAVGMDPRPLPSTPSLSHPAHPAVRVHCAGGEVLGLSADEAAALRQCCHTVDEILDCEGDTVPLPLVDAEVMALVVGLCEQQLRARPPSVVAAERTLPPASPSTPLREGIAWSEFGRALRSAVRSLAKEHEQLGRYESAEPRALLCLALALSYLDNPLLLRMACSQMVEHMRLGHVAPRPNVLDLMAPTSPAAPLRPATASPAAFVAALRRRFGTSAQPPPTARVPPPPPPDESDEERAARLEEAAREWWEEDLFTPDDEPLPLSPAAAAHDTDTEVFSSDLAGAEDILESCLRMLGADNLRLVKGVSPGWRSAARRVLTSEEWQAEHLSVADVLRRVEHKTFFGARFTSRLLGSARSQRERLLLHVSRRWGSGPIEEALPHVAAVLVRRLRTHPTEASTANRHGLLPLHEWLTLGAGCFALFSKEEHLAIIGAMVAAHPPAASSPTPETRLLPLHLVGKQTGGTPQALRAVVTALVEANPAALGATDAEGKVPLHAAVQGRIASATEQSATQLAVVEALLVADPGASRARDHWGRLPLHMATRRDSSAAVVRALLDAHPEAASAADEQGWLPLHWAVKQRANDEVLLALVEANPRALCARDRDGQTPADFEEAHGSACLMGCIEVAAMKWAELKAQAGRAPPRDRRAHHFTPMGALAMGLRLVAAFFTLLAINQGWQLAKSVYDLVTRERDEYEFDM